MVYVISPEPNKRLPSSCGSMDLNGAGSNLSGHQKGTRKAGGEGANAPEPKEDSRHILTNCYPSSNTDDKIADILGDIIRSPQLDSYYDDVVTFYRWLQKVNNLTIVMSGYNHGSEDDFEPFSLVEYQKKAASRWSEDYIKTTLARLYRLKDIVKDEPCLMGSFTCPHEYNKFGEMKNPGMTIDVCFSTLRAGWNRFRMRLYKHFGKTIQVVRIWEPHEMGYPHFHAILLGTFTPADMDFMKTAWAESIGYPSAKDTALEWSETRAIEYPVAYLMKYLTKTLYNKTDGWNAATWVFNAIAWRDGIRLFQPSREIGMAITDKESCKDDKTVYTEILAKGLPRRNIDDDTSNDDLPCLIATPKDACDKYGQEAALNPDPAPFIPLKYRNDFPPPESTADKVKRAAARYGWQSATRWKNWRDFKTVYLPSPGSPLWRDNR